MTKATRSLAGAWRGHFAYLGQAGPTTPFLARIDEDGARLGGETIEPDGFGGIGPRQASIVGIRQGNAVDFTKTYARPSFAYLNPVDYVGRVSEDANTISGVWSLLHLDGTFQMHREVAVAEEAEEATEIERAEPVLIGDAMPSPRGNRCHA